MGKKSWNVYNQDNIDKVRRDEAQARALEEEQERRMQEVDADRRLQVLRGLRPDTPPKVEEQQRERSDHQRLNGRDRKRRKVTGEDDTDRDIRLAQEDAADVTDRAALVRKPTSDAPLTDHKGHINLFPSERSRHVDKNPEAEAEAAKKKREHEDQYTMRFSNAAGFKQGLEKPWYSSSGSQQPSVEDVQSKDVWGNEDPRRREREKMRMSASDPLAMIKKGVKQVREAEHDRKRWVEEKQREIAALEAEQRKRRKRRRHGSEDSLKGFSLYTESEERDRRHRKHSHRHRHRSRS